MKLLPPGMTMADVQQLDRELLASEGLRIEDLIEEMGESEAEAPQADSPGGQPTKTSPRLGAADTRASGP